VNVRDVGNAHTLSIWVNKKGDFALNTKFWNVDVRNRQFEYYGCGKYALFNDVAEN